MHFMVSQQWEMCHSGMQPRQSPFPALELAMQSLNAHFPHPPDAQPHRIGEEKHSGLCLSQWFIEAYAARKIRCCRTIQTVVETGGRQRAREQYQYLTLHLSPFTPILFDTAREGFRQPSGEGGIRTHGTRQGYNGFRDRPVQPLRHLSTNFAYTLTQNGAESCAPLLQHPGTAFIHTTLWQQPTSLV